MTAFDKAWRLLKSEWLGEEAREWRRHAKEENRGFSYWDSMDEDVAQEIRERFPRFAAQIDAGENPLATIDYDVGQEIQTIAPRSWEQLQQYHGGE